METLAEDALLGDAGDLWDDLLAFSAPKDIPAGPKQPSSWLDAAASEPLDADMAAFSPPLGVKVQHFGGGPGGWTLGEYAANTATRLKGTAASFGPPKSGHNTGSSVPGYGAGPQYDAGLSAPSETLWGLVHAAPQPSVAPTATLTGPAPAGSLTWANPAPALLQLGAQQMPNAGAMEIRRMKNREFMRRARQRQRDELERMKATVGSLEKQYTELSLRAKAGRSSGAAHVPSSPKSPSAVVSASRFKAQQQSEDMYAEAVRVANQLGAENMLLRAAIQDKSSWQQHLHHILETVPGHTMASSMNSVGVLGSPQRMPARMASLPVDILDPDAAHAIFGFLPLTEADVSALILDNSHQMHNVRTQLEADLRIGDLCTLSRHVFGWEVVQRVTPNGVMEFMFTKRFSGLSASDIMHRTWANDMELEKFKKVKFDVKRLEVLQEANVNAYILGRDVRSPDKSTVFRSVFLRYLIASTQTLPNPMRKQCAAVDGSGSESEEKEEALALNATGFVLGTHSINRDWSTDGSNAPMANEQEEEEGGGVDPMGFDAHSPEKLVWADLALSIEFLDVEDPSTGETFQRVRWIGRTDYKSKADALRNAADTLTGCLRWELLMISPALSLVSLKL